MVDKIRDGVVKREDLFIIIKVCLCLYLMFMIGVLYVFVVMYVYCSMSGGYFNSYNCC